MKLKTLGRAAGIVSAAAGSYFGSYYIDTLSKIQYSKLGELLLGNYPLEQKAAVGAFVTTYALGVSGCALIVADGLTDIAKGTHHYFGMQLWRKLTKNERIRQRIDEETRHMLEAIDKPIF